MYAELFTGFLLNAGGWGRRGSRAHASICMLKCLQGFHCMLVEGEERCLAKSKGRPHVPVSQKTLSLLRRFYRDHNFK
jgi:hypothetical protein